jgi:ribosomal protein L29
MNKTKTQKEKISLTDLNLTELNLQAKQINSDITKMRLEKNVGRLKNSRSIFNMRKQLARIMTEINVKSKLNSVKSGVSV